MTLEIFSGCERTIQFIVKINNLSKVKNIVFIIIVGSVQFTKMFIIFCCELFENFVSFS